MKNMREIVQSSFEEAFSSRRVVRAIDRLSEHHDYTGERWRRARKTTQVGDRVFFFAAAARF